MTDITICKFGCSSVDGCSGQCEFRAPSRKPRRMTRPSAFGWLCLILAAFWATLALALRGWFH